ncbi:hypothetical protein TGUWTKB_4930 [Candidatus Tachikawaea gelatinosa]|uniref:Uncharacterized protein n=1 Tax=Candidatus Tachikawaea gelatinosa TaxID=1410383 RepID=A0A090AM38_9ENTR|nr:hypothetical protein TGUWTKB_4930 [Candidatus Tachikawaea gelatinosa]
MFFYFNKKNKYSMDSVKLIKNFKINRLTVFNKNQIKKLI